MRRLTLLVLLTPLALAAPDAIYINGKIVTVDARFTIAQAFAITRGKFEAVGKDTDIQKLAGPATRVIDLHGRTVIPGLEDSHLHNAGGGPGVDLSNARSLADVTTCSDIDMMSTNADGRFTHKDGTPYPQP